MNTNADTIASALAVALAKIYETTLIYCFEKKGVLQDINDDESLIRDINPERYEQLKLEKIVSEGMLPKLDNAFAAIKSGVKEVIIGQADELHYLNKGNSFGTILRN